MTARQVQIAATFKIVDGWMCAGLAPSLDIINSSLCFIRFFGCKR